MDTQKTRAHIEALWQKDIIAQLHEYIRIPNQSPMFDPKWQEHGHMEKAVQLAFNWVKKQNITGLHTQILRLPERTPLLYIEIEGQLPGDVLMYGHLDKQPPFDGWRSEEGLSAWEPVEIDGKLYGRGGADDGYAVFASLAAVSAMQAQHIDHPRIVIVIECSEESGSCDLPFYVEEYADKIGNPKLVICRSAFGVVRRCVSIWL
ncbi:MAG TPA: M20/M25/M40 family metallo-hydrolase [Flavobacteriales bacterium]|nr:M20/M25/M40 family metallo-hydrolase [Flavobacteriales bacterium]